MRHRTAERDEPESREGPKDLDQSASLVAFLLVRRIQGFSSHGGLSALRLRPARLANIASSDHAPAPTMSRNTVPITIEKSVRASWAIFQNPLWSRIGNLVL